MVGAREQFWYGLERPPKRITWLRTGRSTLAPYDFPRTDVRAAKTRSDDDNIESEREHGRTAFGIDDGRGRKRSNGSEGDSEPFQIIRVNL